MKHVVFLVSLGVTLFAASKAHTTLELYTNMSRLSYQFNENKKIHLQVPEFVDDDLQISSNCEIIKSELSSAIPLPKEGFEEKLSTLSKQVDAANQKVATSKAKRKLLESYSLKNTPLNELQNSLKIFEDTYLEVLGAEKEISKKAKELTLELQKATMKQNYRKIKNLDISLKCGNNAATTVSFPIKGLTFESFARFNANTKENSVDVVQESIIKHSLGDLLKNVDIKIHSFAYLSFIDPIQFAPYYLDIYRNENLARMQDAVPMANKSSVKKIQVAYGRGFESSSKTKSFWKIASENLAPGEDNRVVFNRQKLPVKFINYIDGYGGVRAYLQGEIEPKESILQRRAKFEIDGVLVGERFMQPIYKESKKRIYFGENSFIKITKEIEKDFTKESFFGSSKLIKKAWRYEIVNKAKTKEEIILIERMPVSKNAKIKVELIDKVKPQKVEKNGKVQWSFVLEPGESKEIIFGYSVERPIES